MDAARLCVDAARPCMDAARLCVPAAKPCVDARRLCIHANPPRMAPTSLRIGPATLKTRMARPPAGPSGQLPRCEAPLMNARPPLRGTACPSPITPTPQPHRAHLAHSTISHRTSPGCHLVRLPHGRWHLPNSPQAPTRPCRQMGLHPDRGGDVAVDTPQFAHEHDNGEGVGSCQRASETAGYLWARRRRIGARVHHAQPRPTQ